MSQSIMDRLRVLVDFDEGLLRDLLKPIVHGAYEDRAHDVNNGTASDQVHTLRDEFDLKKHETNEHRQEGP